MASNISYRSSSLPVLYASTKPSDTIKRSDQTSHSTETFYGFKYLRVIVKLIIQLSWQLVLKNLWFGVFFPVHEFQRFQFR